MPKPPKRRIVTRYVVKTIEPGAVYVAYGYSGPGMRYIEADVFGETREEVAETARERVNKSWSHQGKKR